MLEPLGRFPRDSTLFQFTEKRLRDFIDPEHLLIRIDEQLDFAKLVARLENRYCRDQGRPAIHPEVVVRALLICSLYNIASFRRLSSAISESIVFHRLRGIYGCHRPQRGQGSETTGAWPRTTRQWRRRLTQ